MAIIWLTGNSGAGKTTLADMLCKDDGWIKLDGDEMRSSISLGAGFSKADREEHNLRVARLAKVLHKQQFNIVISVIAPFRSTREKINSIIPECRWVYIKRDGLDKPDRPYEEPYDTITIDIGKHNVNESYKLLRRAIHEQT